MPNTFSHNLLAWFEQHGRHDLPWQIERDPYRVWISEIMLQQTQVSTVVPYYQRFIAQCPSISALAEANIDVVLNLWSGLGYYARARNLHQSAKLLVTDHGGVLPGDITALQTLPGIGRSTAAAILALSHGERHAILDGNVKRVLARQYAIEEWTGKAAVTKQLWALAEQHTPAARVTEYTQAIMDLGATLCTRGTPHCDRCPVKSSCLAFEQNLTRRIPAPRPKRNLPEKQIQFLIIQRHDGRVLLARRPPTGIWGGLWSFPEIEIDAEPIAALEALGMTAVGAVERLALIRHTFTHFRLNISPRLMRVNAEPSVVMESAQWLWYNIANGHPIGLPKPVTTLLEQIQRPIGNTDDAYR